MSVTRIKKLMANNPKSNDEIVSESSYLMPNSQSAYTAINENGLNSYQNNIQFQPPTYQEINHGCNTKICPTCKGKGRIGYNNVLD